LNTMGYAITSAANARSAARSIVFAFTRINTRSSFRSSALVSAMALRSLACHHLGST
jgi:hypothetical protein